MPIDLTWSLQILKWHSIAYKHVKVPCAIKSKSAFSKIVGKITFIYAAALSEIRLNINAEKDRLYGALLIEQFPTKKGQN